MLKSMKTLLNVKKSVTPPKELQREEDEDKPRKSKRRQSIRELDSAGYR